MNCGLLKAVCHQLRIIFQCGVLCCLIALNVVKGTDCCVCACVQEEFCFPVECLSLTVEEVMHIRQVLVKAELEKFQQYKEIYTAMKKGKVSFDILFFHHWQF